ncbi:MAG: TonB-dependent receptor plug domain-containing protein [Dokdonia sp.]|jgi:hypothetical protein
MNSRSCYILGFFCLLSVNGLLGQSQSVKVSLVKVLQSLQEKHQVSFNYESTSLQDIRITPPRENQSLEETLSQLSIYTGFDFTEVGNAVYIITKTMRLCGYLYDAQLQEPLSGATIQTATSNTLSDADGYFEVTLRSSDDTVFIQYLGYKTIIRKASFFSQEQCARISMLRNVEVLPQVAIRGYLVKGVDKTNQGNTFINYQALTLLPGLIESDVLQTIQALPGVQSSDETVSNITIRGGSHDQNLILWDGIKMYQSGHFFGLISSFNPHMTHMVTLINNGTSATYAGGVSGVINMQTDTDINRSFDGIVDINLLNAAVFLDIPLHEKSSVQIAARASLDDLIRTPTYQNYFDRVTQDSEVTSIGEVASNRNQSFNFYDASIRYLYAPSAKDKIRFNLLGIVNDLTFDESSTIDGTLTTRESSLSQNSFAAGLQYSRQWSEKFETQLELYETDYKLQAINSNIEENQRFLQENIVSESSVKWLMNFKQTYMTYQLGYEFVESEITNLNDIDLPRFVRRDSEVLREHAGFGQLHYSDTALGFYTTAGIRANYSTTYDRWLIQPRLSVQKDIGEAFGVSVQGEFKHQNVSQVINFQNDFLGIEKRRWLLTDNDSIPVIQSKQASIGVNYNEKGWLADLTAFYKEVDGISAQSQGFTTKYEFARAIGSYQVVGAEFLVRKKFGKFQSWLSYSYMDNTYTFSSLEPEAFPSNFDISHSFTLGTTYSTNRLETSIGINYRRGNPYSAPIGDTAIAQDAIAYSATNTQRLRDYLRADVSAVYQFRINRSIRSEVGVSVWNFLDRSNEINTYYRLQDDEAIAQFSRFSLGITSNAVLRIFF